MPRLRVSMGKFLIKNAVLGEPRWKTPNFFSHESFCLFVVAEMFLGVALFLEVYSVVKTGCTPGRPPWLDDKSNEMFGFWTGWNIHFFSDFMLSNLSTLKFIFHSHATWNFHTQIYFNSNTNVHIYLPLTCQITNILGRNSHRKTLLFIQSLQKLCTFLF